MIRHRHFNINSQDCGPLTAVACAPGEGVPLPPSSGSDFMQGGAVAARVAHNHEVVGASPTPATSIPSERRDGGSGNAAAPARLCFTSLGVAECLVLNGAHGERGFAAASARAPETSGGPQSRPRPEADPVGANGNGAGEGGLVFSDPVMILIRAVALYESLAPEQLVADLVAAKAEGIGLSVLARAVLEFEHRNTPSAVTDGRGERRVGCSGDAALPASRDPP